MVNELEYLNVLVSQLPRVALMGWFVWLMDQWRVQAGWRSASMECGEECVLIWSGCGCPGPLPPLIPESCVDNWGTLSIQEEVSQFIFWRSLVI